MKTQDSRPYLIRAVSLVLGGFNTTKELSKWLKLSPTKIEKLVDSGLFIGPQNPSGSRKGEGNHIDWMLTERGKDYAAMHNINPFEILEKEKKRKKEVWSPIIEEESEEIHPAIDFIPHNGIYIGTWLKSKEQDSDKVQNILWMLTDNGLVLPEEVGLDLKTQSVLFEKRVSNRLLKIKSLVDLVEIVDNILEVTNIRNFNNPNTPIIGKHKTLLSDLRNFLKSGGVQLYPLHSLQSLLNCVISEMFEAYKYYIDLDDDSLLFLSLWTFGTYFFPIFRSYPYVYLNGTKRCGKTTILDVAHKMAFNSIKAGSISASSVFRLIESVRPTLLIDEQDALVSSRNSPELRTILLNGYKNGARVYRTMQRGDKVDFVVQGYDTYCPKMIANITGMDDVLEDRTVLQTLLRTKEKRYGDRSQEIDYDDRWERIRELCYCSVMCFWKEVKHFYESFENKTEIISRDWELWKPILALSFLSGHHEKMVGYAKRKADERIEEDINEQRDAQLTSSLVDLVQSEPGDWYQVSAIVEVFKTYFEDEEKIYLDSGEFRTKKIYPKWVTPNWVGRSMKRLRFKKKRTVAGKKQYFLSRPEVVDLAKRLGIKVEDSD